MLEYAPKKLTFTTEKAQEVPKILSTFLTFLDTTGHIKNGVQLSTVVKENSRSFLKLIPKETKKGRKTTTRRTSKKKAAATTILPDVKVGRNDPCPCGSGKKYKKCCGRSQ